MLLDAGADVNIKSNFGYTPLFLIEEIRKKFPRIQIM